LGQVRDMTDQPTATDRTPASPRVVLIVCGFLATRLLVLPAQQPASDVDIYARYAHELAAASRDGASFYEYHARVVDRETEEARAAGKLIGSIDENKDVEYPPLALAVMRLPALGLDGGAAGDTPSPDYLRAYRARYRLLMAASDALLFVLLLVLVRRLFPKESSGEKTERLLGYVACTAALWFLLYDRLDLPLALLIVLALALLLGRVSYLWSYAVLAVAINFKLTPVVLAPVWVVGSLPADRRLEFTRPRVLLALAGRSALLIGMVLACFLPFYLSYGNACLGFLRYHRERGLEIGSVLASLPLALRAVGTSLDVTYSYKSINLLSSSSHFLVALAPWLTGILLLLAMLLLLAHFRRVSATAEGDLPAGATAAQRDPRAVVSFTLLFLMLFLAGNKVFSPQYLLWLAPLVCLIPLPPRGRRWFTWTFLAVCLLSTVLVFLYVLDLVDLTAAQTVPRSFKPPTTRLAVITVVRNLLSVGLTVGLVWHLIRHRPDAPAASAVGRGRQGS
jgi:hypothetical protein